MGGKAVTPEIYKMPGHLIRRLHQKSTQVFQQRVRQAGHDITPVQFAAMEALRGAPGIDQAQLAHLIAYDRATIGGVIERLEKRGLVQRAANPRDRRARLVSLTAAGLALIDALLPVVRGLQADILDGLAPGEREALCRYMARTLAMPWDEAEGVGP
ncbi:MarR family transcriptional regulator [Rhodobacterales bacterium HKCCSP123]|nr:MarR family transcriptional regulator [Rhodobacterales bacterium HKCCSP123]